MQLFCGVLLSDNEAIVSKVGSHLRHHVDTQEGQKVLISACKKEIPEAHLIVYVLQ
jgi:hypothetical protein